MARPVIWIPRHLSDTGAVKRDRIVRSGAWDSWSPAFMVGRQVTGAGPGIVGMGGVGRSLAKKARWLQQSGAGILPGPGLVVS